jgi:hypothetical protein
VEDALMKVERARRFAVLKYVLFAVLSILVVFAPCCHRETEEDRVKKVITSVQEAAEKKEVRSVLEHISKSYKDPRGNDYEGIKGLLAFYFLRHQKVSVYIPGIEVTINDSAAQARFQAILAGDTKGESASVILPEALGAYQFEVSLAKEGGQWKITSANWEGLPALSSWLIASTTTSPTTS